MDALATRDGDCAGLTEAIKADESGPRDDGSPSFVECEPAEFGARVGSKVAQA